MYKGIIKDKMHQFEIYIFSVWNLFRDTDTLWIGKCNKKYFCLKFYSALMNKYWYVN